MKSILSFVLVSLLSISTAVAQNRHYVDGPTAQCNFNQNSVTITGKIAGCGEGPLFVLITGEFDCVNGGGNVPSADNWSDFSVILPAGQKNSGGNIVFSVTLASLCPKKQWTFATRNLQITLFRSESDASNGINKLLGPTAVTPNCF